MNSKFADYQLKTAQNYVDLEYITRKLIEEYEVWCLKLQLKKKVAIGDTSRDLHLDNGKGAIG
jgi:hypothetical protein